MTGNTKIFFVGFLISLPLWWNLNVFNKDLEDFFFGLELAKDPHLYTAHAALQAQLNEALPFQKKEVTPLEITSSSALSVLVKPNQEITTLFEKNPEKRTPIASLTKLMGAFVVARHIPLDTEIEITRQAVLEEEDFGQLQEGDTFLAKELLYPMLMESSNDASAAFALELGGSRFVELMNQQARLLNLNNTLFVDHAGLDPDVPGGAINYSTAKDVFALTRHLKTFYSNSVFDVLSQKERDLYTTDGRLHHTMENTNELLLSNGFPTKVLGGKTGWTPEARGALVLVVEAPKAQGYIVTIVLGSENRFGDMRKLVHWVFDSWRF